jgi:hypothetical protein
VLIGRVQETFAILRVVLFLVLAIASHWLAIGWRNRELQIATGLGLYSLGSLVGTLAHQHQSVTRPELPAHAQNILLELAGTAHRQRAALEMRRVARDGK